MSLCSSERARMKRCMGNRQRIRRTICQNDGRARLLRNSGCPVEKQNLESICRYRNEAVFARNAKCEEYISTESMVANRGGITPASSAPSDGKVKRYRKDDVLVSNIRPYFKKIWHASHDGACSNDVLVFEATKCDPSYLFWVLSSDAFFDYMMKTAKGTKMPRGDKKAIMGYQVGLPPVDQQKAICEILESLQEKIALNNQLNGYLAALGETMANRCSNETDGTLDDICSQSKETVSLEAAQLETYVSTENLLPNKAGLQLSAGLPTSGKVTRYRKGDTLVANIRPYFKKIWCATDEGTCSGDVIVFRANDARYAPYVFFSLCRDEFFEYVMLGAKGTKMPRGDKKQMMTFPICTNCNSTDLQLLQELASTIGANHAENRQLARLRDTLLPKLMSGEIDVSKVDPTQLNSHLADC